MLGDGAGPMTNLPEKITKGRDTQDWVPRSLRWQVAGYHLLPDGSSGPLVHWGWHENQAPAPSRNGVGLKDAEIDDGEDLFGGQGTGNTWWLVWDLKKFAWTEYGKDSRTSEVTPGPGANPDTWVL